MDVECTLLFGCECFISTRGRGITNGIEVRCILSEILSFDKNALRTNMHLKTMQLYGCWVWVERISEYVSSWRPISFSKHEATTVFQLTCAYNARTTCNLGIWASPFAMGRTRNKTNEQKEREKSKVFFSQQSGSDSSLYFLRVRSGKFLKQTSLWENNTRKSWDLARPSGMLLIDAF